MVLGRRLSALDVLASLAVTAALFASGARANAGDAPGDAGRASPFGAPEPRGPDGPDGRPGGEVRPPGGVWAAPPRLLSVKLDDPREPELPLLRAVHDAATERLGPLRRYTLGRFGAWRKRPWRELRWGLGDVTDAATPSAPHDLSSNVLGSNDWITNDWITNHGGTNGLDGGAGRRQGVAEPAGLTLQVDPLAAARPWLSASLDDLGPLGALGPVGQGGLATTGPSLASNGLDALFRPPPKPIRDWRCRRRAVTFMRFGGETESFPLLRCDGSIAPEALDRLSILLRPPDAPDPGDLLPDEPDPSAGAGEWLPHVRVVQPRLVWLLQSIADAYPWKPIHVFSGYRPASPEKKSHAGSHASLHAMGRAVDIKVLGVPNATLFQLCRKLDDVGCGYYPNGPFVHVDVRKGGTGRAFWVDVSLPGEPSRFVDSWPGVVDGGALVWMAGSHAQSERAPASVSPPGMGGAQVAP